MFGYTIIKMSKLEDLQAAEVSLTARCTNLSDEINELRAKIDRMTSGLRNVGKKRETVNNPAIDAANAHAESARYR
jgi:uncharacterized coiled-coil protein SlyX